MTFNEMRKTVGVYTVNHYSCSKFIVIRGKNDKSRNVVLWCCGRYLEVANDCWKNKHYSYVRLPDENYLIKVENERVR